MGSRVRGRKLSTCVTALAIALACPCFLIAGLAAWQWRASERDHRLAQAAEAADATSAQVDRYLAGITGMLQALATSPALDRGDLARFDAQARELLSLRGVHTVLRDPTGRPLVDTRLPWGEALPHGDPAIARITAEHRAPYVSDLVLGPVADAFLVAVAVPVLRGGEALYVLSAGIPAHAIAALLRRPAPGEGNGAVIADRQGRIIAGSDDRDELVGRPMPALARHPGAHGSRRDLPGRGTEASSHRRSALSGWLVTVAPGRGAVDAPLRRTERLLGGLAVLVLLVGAGVSGLIVRRLLTAHRRLAATLHLDGRRPARDGPAGPASSGIVEVDELGRVLAAASSRLIARAEALERSNGRLEARIRDRTAALEVSRTLLSATLEHMDQGLVLLGPDQRVQLFNAKARGLLHLPDDVLRDGASFREIRAFQNARGDFSSLVAAAPGEITGSDPGRLPRIYDWLRPDGSTLEVRRVPLPDGGSVNTFTDVSERRAAEAAVRESEARHRLLAEHMSDVVVWSRLDTTRLYVSPSARAVFGYDPEELVGRRGLQLLHPDDTVHLERAIRALGAGEAAELTLQLRYRHKDGRWIRAEAAFSVTYDEATGTPNGYVGAIRDITDRYDAEAALRESEDHFRHTVELNPQVPWTADPQGNVVSYSPRWLELTGQAPGEPEGTGWVRALHPDDVAPTMAVFAASLGSGEPVDADYRILIPSKGEYRWQRTRAYPRRDRSGAIVRWYGVVEDVHDRKLAQAALQASEERLALALENGSDGIWEWQRDGDRLWFSSGISVLLGHPAGDIDVSVDAWAGHLHPEDRERTRREFHDHLKGLSPSFEIEHRLLRADGSFAAILARGRVVSRDEAGWATRVVGTFIDITERKQAEARANHLARHDLLTGLPNRMFFHERLSASLGRLATGGGPCALLCGDLDRFKAINDTLGHAAGDAVLVAVAERLRAVAGHGAFIARLGGDEFVMLLEGDAARRGETEAIAQAIIAAVSEPITLGDRQVQIGMSLGIGFAPVDGLASDATLRCADLALYRAKAERRCGYRIYEPAMDEAVRERMSLEADLRQALARGEFELHYQPVVELSGERILGAEALLRWRHPERGLVSPAVFVPVAEELGLIKPIGSWVLRTACREAASWPRDMRVAVNVSAVQFEQAGLVEEALQALASAGLAGHRLELEITETALIQDEARVTETLDKLRSLGIRTALDDFGTGYSSLSYLWKFPFDKLKLDRSFVKDIEHPDMKRIVRAIVALGAGLNMSITAEGVETADQLEAVRRKGCTDAQGFYYSKPLAADAFAKFLLHRDSAAEAA